MKDTLAQADILSLQHYKNNDVDPDDDTSGDGEDDGGKSGGSGGGLG
tara:strand:+ start:98880 stop:99020 length:141 start_codon:yes stop_codon:yes gene_type:complete